MSVEMDGKLMIPDKLTQQEIAERVGASRDMVSRIFRDLTAGGYITVENRFITINKKPPARWLAAGRSLERTLHAAQRRVAATSSLPAASSRASRPASSR